MFWCSCLLFCFRRSFGIPAKGVAKLTKVFSELIEEIFPQRRTKGPALVTSPRKSKRTVHDRPSPNKPKPRPKPRKTANPETTTTTENLQDEVETEVQVDDDSNTAANQHFIKFEPETASATDLSSHQDVLQDDVSIELEERATSGDVERSIAVQVVRKLQMKDEDDDTSSETVSWW